MTEKKKSYFDYFWVLIFLLVFSLYGLRKIPWWKFWGLDMHNIYSFHHCFAMNSPYGVLGQQCGDVLDRPLVYPPLLYWSFLWLRTVGFTLAMVIWSSILSLGTLVILTKWAKVPRLNWRHWCFFFLLIPQFPLVFAIERGNSDFPVLVLWTAAWAFYNQRKYFWSGALGGLSIMFKIYPLFAVTLVGVGFIPSFLYEKKLRPALSFASGVLFSCVFLFFAFFKDSMAYFFEALPLFASSIGGYPALSHSIPYVVEGYPIAARVISLALLFAWIKASWLAFEKDPALVFSGALAISTYFSSTSYDYNLITTYPLLVLLFVRALGSKVDRHLWVTLILTVLALVGNKSLFENRFIHAWQAQVELQVLALAYIGLMHRRFLPTRNDIP